MSQIVIAVCVVLVCSGLGWVLYHFLSKHLQGQRVREANQGLTVCQQIFDLTEQIPSMQMPRELRRGLVLIVNKHLQAVERSSPAHPLLGYMRGKLANYVYRMPVNQGFTTHAGRYIWGFPKWVTDVDVHFNEHEARARFNDDDQLVFEISAKAGGKSKAPAQEAPSLAVRNGKAWKTVGITEGEGLRFSMGGNPPRIGEEHSLAKTLRALGLPKKPLCSVSMARAKLRFEGPEAVAIGQPFSR